MPNLTLTINGGLNHNSTITNCGSITINNLNFTGGTITLNNNAGTINLNIANVPGFREFGYLAPLPVAPALLLPAPPRQIQQANHSKINTHTASIHKSVSDSAVALQKAYPETDYQRKFLDKLQTILQDPKHVQTILDNLKLSNEQQEVLPTNDHLKRCVNSGIERINNSTYWRDPCSQISLASIFKTILVAINSLADQELQINACLCLLEQIYRLQTEYSHLGYMNSSASCDPGVFNGLIYSQQTIFPDQIKILIQTIAHASVFLQYRMLAFAKNIYLNATPETCDSVEKFSELVDAAITPEIGATIVREVVEEYYIAFNYNSCADAIKDFSSETLDKHCKTIAGCATADLFDFLPLDLTKLFENLTAEKSPPTPPIPKAKPAIIF